MRLIIVLLTTAILQVSAAGYAQRITLSEKNASLEQVFQKIRQQTGYDVLYQDKILSGAKPVNLKIKNVPLDQALEEVLKGQSLSYAINDQTIVIKKKEPSFLDRVINAFNAVDVRGRIVGEDGAAIVGATVSVKGVNKSAITDQNGAFYIADVDERSMLVISYVGYLTKEVAAAAKTMGNITLVMSDSKLDEVQVIAYGTTTRRLSTGNVSTVKAEDIAKQPVSNPLQAIQGRMAGVYINQNTGLPGGSFDIQIRGKNSLNANIGANDPLYIIDGVPYTARLIANSNPMLGNPLNFINPSDIESIDILKDADATSIYGSRGANGVVLITSKKGATGDLRVNLNIYSGIGQADQRVKLMNTQQYLEMRRQAFKNDNMIPNTGNAVDILLWDQNKYTDWQDKLIGGTANYKDAQLSISGGTANLQYVFSGGYHRESTVLPTKLAGQKKSISFNLANNSNNQKFKLTATGNYIVDETNLPNTAAAIANYIVTPPNAPDPINEDGTLNWGPQNLFFANPYALLKRPYKGETNNLMGNSVLSYNFFDGLSVKSSFGYTDMQTDEITALPIAAQRQTPSVKGSSSFRTNNVRSWVVEPQITYNKIFEKHNFDILIGGTFQENKSDGKIFNGFGYTSDTFLENLQAAPTITTDPFTNVVYRYNALFGKLGYNFNERYLIN